MSRLTFGFGLALVTLTLGSVSANDPPDSDTNPVSGYIETVESVAIDGVTNIRYSIDPGPGLPTVVVNVTSNSSPDSSPRIAICTDGLSGVAWWRDASVDTVFIRTRDAVTQTWTSETAVSDTSADARNPAIVTDGSDLWVAYEADAGGGDTSIEVRLIQDDPVPIVTLAPSVSFGGDIDTLIHFEQGELWVTWVDSSSDVGWSAYDSATDTWSTADYESYSADSVADARGRVQTTVLGN